MNTSRVAHLRVAADNVVTQCFQYRLFQRAHAQSIKRAMENVTLTLSTVVLAVNTLFQETIVPTRSPASATLSTANGFNHFADCVDHELRLLLVYFMAAIRFGDVFSIGDKFRELLVRFLLCGIRHIAEVRWGIGGQLA